MLFFVAAVCVRWQLPAVAPSQVSVSELGRMEKGDWALLPFDASGGAFFVTPNKYSVAIDRGNLGYTKGGYNVWYGYNGTTQGLFTLGNEPARVFVCAETTTELRIVGCYLGDNGFDVISPGTGKIEETKLPKQRIGYILVDTNHSISFFVNVAKGAVKIRVTEPNGRTALYSGNLAANIPETTYNSGSAAFVELEVVEDFEGELQFDFDGDQSHQVFPDTRPSDAGGSPEIHSEREILKLSALESIDVDTVLQVPMAPYFSALFGVTGAMLVLFYLCWCLERRVWVSKEEYITLRGELRKRSRRRSSDL